MTNYQARLIGLSIICSGIAASGHYALGAVAYGLWIFLDTLVCKEY